MSSTTPRSFNHYTEWGNNIHKKSPSTSSANKNNNDPTHRINQHSLQQRGRISNQRPSSPCSPGQFHPAGTKTGGRPVPSGVGGSLTPPRPAAGSSSNSEQNSMSNLQQKQQQQQLNQNQNQQQQNSPLIKNVAAKVTTPVVTAKGARNFWKRKEENPIKSWRKPLSTTNNIGAAVGNAVGAVVGAVVGTSAGTGTGTTAAASITSTNNDNNHMANFSPSRNSVSSTGAMSRGTSTFSSTTTSNSKGNSIGTNNNIQKSSHSHEKKLRFPQTADDSWVNEDEDIHNNQPKKMREPKKLFTGDTDTDVGGCDSHTSGAVEQQHHQQYQSAHVPQSTKSNSYQKQQYQEQQQHQQRSQQHHQNHNTNSQHQYREKDKLRKPLHQQQSHHQRQYSQPSNYSYVSGGGRGNGSENGNGNASVTTNSTTNDGTIGEMQIKLDIAAAQLLTEEMKYKDLMEQFLLLQKDDEIRIRKLQMEANGRKSEDSSANDKLSSQIQILESELDKSRREITQLRQQEQQQQDQNNMKKKSQTDENEKLKKKVQEQKNELNELCMEVNRLHSNHRADSDILNHKMESMKRENDDFSMRERNYHDEITSLKAQLKEKKEKIQQHQQQQQQHQQRSIPAAAETNSRHGEHLNQVQGELDDIRRDFGKLAEETERLEKELEAVTEDRDELLRRSVLYHNAAADGNISPKTSPKVVDGKKIVSSLNESSVQDYELQRVRETLQESEAIRKKQETRIQELEKLFSAHKEMESLDLSAIDMDSMSLISIEKQGKFASIEELSKMQKDCTKHKREANEANDKLNGVEKERNKLQECLADAMQEIEKLEEDKITTQRRHEDFAEELTIIINKREAEIEQLQKNATNHPDSNLNVSDPLREELLNMVGWLDSSTRINGSPSIECMLTDPPSYAEEISDQPSDEITNEESALKSVYLHVKSLQKKLAEAREEISELKKQVPDCHPENESSELMDSSSFIMEADITSKKIWKQLQEMQIEEGRNRVTDNLRESLKEAAKLINSLTEHIFRLDEEKSSLHSKLSNITSKNKQLELAVNEASNESKDMNLGQNSFGKPIQVSPFELDKKNGEIVELKLEVGQLREQLKELDSELRSSGDNDEMGEMPTPTKSNRSSKHKKGIDSILPSSHQSSNEEDDMRSRMAHLELKRLKNDLKIKASAEETLKTIIQDSSRQLATITAQAENLAQEKSGLLIRLKEFEMEKNKLENDLHKVNEEAKILQNYKRNHSENESSKEISHLKSELKSIAKERKKLKKSLADAVEMLNALQEHVLTAEKERKKMKKQLRSVVLNCSADSKPSETNHSDAEQSSHADQMATQTTILQLKSHIVGLDHEIRILIDRIDELEESKKTAKVPNNDSSKVDIHRLQKELVEAQNALIVAKGMLGEVTEVNKELLSDLRATEIEEEETMKELEILKHKLNEAQKELSNVNLAASSALKKFDGLMANSDVGGTGRNDSIIGLINRLERYSVALLDLNRTKEHAIEEKNLMILELLDKVKSRQ